MSALRDDDQRRAACAGIDPRTHYEWAWNDKTGRPAPGLAKALSICEGCPVVIPCLIAGLDEIHGIWGGAVPPERGQVRGISHAIDADPSEILYALGEATMRVNKETGAVTFGPEDISVEDQMRDPHPDFPAADIDAAYRVAWDEAIAEWGSALDVPADIRDAISEDHRKAHVRRVAAEKVNHAKKVATVKAAEKATLPARCPKGHDLRGYMPSTGKPVLTAGGLCRMCQAGGGKG